MIDHFAAATKYYQWIHVDKQRDEKESPYKLTIDSWLYVDRFDSLKMAYNFGLEEFRFPYPVVEGSFLRGIVQVESIED